MKRRTNEELVQMLWQGLTRASDYSTSSLQTTRRKAWDYFLNRPRGDEVDGRSQVQDTTIRDTHNALMATIMPSYATDNLVQFEPTGRNDEDQADAESQAVNNIFTEDNSGYLELSNAVSDALLFRNGVMKVWVEDNTENVTERFDGEKVSAGAVKAYYAQQGAELVGLDESDGVIEATTRRTTQRLKVASIEPGYFYVDPNQADQDLQSSQFIAERWIAKRSDLLDLGVKRAKVDRLPQITDEGLISAPGISSTDIQAKFVDGQSTYEMSETWSEQRCECFWIHTFVDGERWRFLVGSQELLLKDPVNFFPYASGTGWPVPHRWSGLGLYDLLRETQDTKTGILRQFMDNLNISNNARPVYDPAETNEADILAGAPGRGIRSRNPIGVTWAPSIDVTSQAVAALQYMDERGSRQAGAALDMATAEAQSVKDVSGLSVEMQLGPKEQMASQISRNLAETLIRNTFLLIHRTLRENYDGAIMYRKTDEWVEANPSEWQPRNRINVTVGLSPGDRRRHRAALEYVMQMQLQLIQGGAANIAVSYKTYHNALTDWLKAAELDGAEKYFLDPDGQESQRGQQAAAEASQQPDPMAAAAMQMEAAKLQEDARQHDTELQFKYTELQQETEIEEAKLVENGIQARISTSAQAGGAGGTDTRNGADRGSEG
jgi:hypothetical protein